MKRLIFIAISIFFGTQSFSQHSDNRPPNVIYIYADDLGYGEVGSFGQSKISTPNIDRMAKEGMRLTQHYAGAPVCAPSRCILLTGMHSGHAYIRSNSEMPGGGFADNEEKGQFPLTEGTFTVGKLFQNVGYKTAAIGKWGLGMANNSGAPTKQGFDYFYGYLDQKQAHNYYPTHLWENEKRDTLNNHYFLVHTPLDSTTTKVEDFGSYKGSEYAITKMTEKALSFIDENRNHPFFLYLPYTIPHVSLQAPQEFVESYIGKFEETPYYGQQRYAPSRYPLSTYAAMISYLDYQVGVIMTELKNKGIEDKTIVIFSSDNGPTYNGGVNALFFNSTAGLRGLKQDLFEGGIRVPFIAKWPGKIPAGTVSDLPSAQYDMLATFADITGQKIPETDGISILPELLGMPSMQKKHAFLYFEYPSNGSKGRKGTAGQIAVRMGDWKAIKIGLKENPETPWLLFNLKMDPNENQDLSKSKGNIHLLRRAEQIIKEQHRPSIKNEWEFINHKESK